MRTNRKRVPVPFMFRASDGLGASGKLVARSYGSEVESVFSRASRSAASDRNGALFPVAYGIPALGMVGSEPTVLLQATTDNVVLQSENFGTTWTQGGTGTRTAAAHVTTGISLDLLGDTDVTAGTHFTQVPVFTGNGSKTVSIFMKAGSATGSAIQIFDETAGFVRSAIAITWTAGVPSLAVALGTSVTLNPVELIADGVYRLSFVGAGVIAANTNRLYVYITSTTAADLGTVYAGGVQAQNSASLGGYIKTTTAAVTRASDACYFPFTLVPQAMTVYVRFLESGTISLPASARVLNIGVDSVPRLFIGQTGGAGVYNATWRNGSSVDVTSTLGAAPALGDTVEIIVTLAADGVMQIAQSVNAAATTSGSATAARALDAFWELPRLYLNSSGGNVGQNAFTHVVVALGTKTMAEMRDLAERG